MIRGVIKTAPIVYGVITSFKHQYNRKIAEMVNVVVCTILIRSCIKLSLEVQQTFLEKQWVCNRNGMVNTNVLVELECGGLACKKQRWFHLQVRKRLLLQGNSELFNVIGASVYVSKNRRFVS